MIKQMIGEEGSGDIDDGKVTAGKKNICIEIKVHKVDFNRI